MGIAEKVKTFIGIQPQSSSKLKYTKIGAIEVETSILNQIHDWSGLPQGDISMFLKAMKVLNIDGTKIDLSDYRSTLDTEIDVICFGGKNMVLLEPNVYGHPFSTPHIRVYDDEGATEYSVNPNGEVSVDFVMRKPYSLEVIFVHPSKDFKPYPTLLVKDSTNYHISIEFTNLANNSFERISDLEDEFLGLKSIKDLSPYAIISMVSQYYKDPNFSITLWYSYVIIWNVKITDGQITSYQKNKVCQNGKYLQVRRIEVKDGNLVEYDIRNGDDERLTLSNGKFSFETKTENPKQTLDTFYEIRNNFINEAESLLNALV